MTETAQPLRVVVLGDSTAFVDGHGPQLPTTPHLYPQVMARRLREVLDRPVEVQVVARPGLTVRDAAHLVRSEQHLQFDLLGPADAVVVGLGSFDHAPAGVPAAVEALVPYVRPPGVRRRVRRLSRAAYPLLVRATGGSRRRTPPAEFARAFAVLLDHVRGLTWGRAAGVVLGPTSHRAAYYGHRHPRFAEAERDHLDLAERHGFVPVAAWPHVRPHLAALNVDGIHWPAAAHAAVGDAVATALLDVLEGRRPPPGLPADVAAALAAARDATAAAEVRVTSDDTSGNDER